MIYVKLLKEDVIGFGMHYHQNANCTQDCLSFRSGIREDGEVLNQYMKL